MPSKKNYFFSCVCIKWFKSAKKDIKMWSWNYWQRYFWVNRKDLEVESFVTNWAQIFDKCDPEKQRYRQELTPNAEYQRCKVFVWNDLVERKIKSCRKSSKRFLEFLKKVRIRPWCSYLWRTRHKCIASCIWRRNYFYSVLYWK